METLMVSGGGASYWLLFFGHGTRGRAVVLALMDIPPFTITFFLISWVRQGACVDWAFCCLSARFWHRVDMAVFGLSSDG